MRVIVEDGATFYPHNYLGLVGPVKFINNGTIIADYGGDVYWYPEAWFVNLGLIDISTYTVSFDQSQFPDSTSHEIGTFVNRGTVQFSKSGGTIYADGGQVYQCEHGVFKYTFGATTYSSASTLFKLSVDGYIGVNFEKDYKLPSYQTLLYWDEASYADQSKKGVFIGGITEFTNGPGTIATPQILCLDGSIGYLYLYSLFDGTCSKHGTGYTNTINAAPVGGVCNKNLVPKELTDLVASCPVSKNCGIDTGTPIGDSNSASSFPVSLALLVSLMGFLFYQH